MGKGMSCACMCFPGNQEIHTGLCRGFWGRSFKELMEMSLLFLIIPSFLATRSWRSWTPDIRDGKWGREEARACRWQVLQPPMCGLIGEHSPPASSRLVWLSISFRGLIEEGKKIKWDLCLCAFCSSTDFCSCVIFSSWIYVIVVMTHIWIAIFAHYMILK